MYPNSIYKLLQISDSAFPRGSFAHSLGLESYVDNKKIIDSTSLNRLIENLLKHSVGTLDAVYLKESYNLTKERDLEKILRLDIEFHATKPISSLRNASHSVGKEFLRTSHEFLQNDHIGEYLNQINNDSAYGHYPITFGVVSSVMDIPLEQTMESFFFGFVSSLVSAGVRLIPIGQTDGQRIIAKMEKLLPQIIEDSLTRTISESFSFAPAHEIQAMSHHRLHTRLFIS
tara:strand:- start:8593 stop:9282 length:690 start_codon:yes stop_codon:yes gene_type:complete